MNALAPLTIALAVVYFVAAILHTGITIPLGPVTLAFPEPSQPATVAETIIGVALTLAAAAMVLRARPSRIVWGLYVFALAGTLLGFTIILLVGRGGPDLWVHLLMLAGLAGGFALLARERRRSSSA
ncbi:MAG: hypothetical protein ACRDF9_10795 [Candidatus Limnocylindria bacterium]